MHQKGGRGDPNNLQSLQVQISTQKWPHCTQISQLSENSKRKYRAVESRVKTFGATTPQ